MSFARNDACLRHRLGRRQIKSFSRMLEVASVGAITKRLLGAEPAAADAEPGAAAEAVGLALSIDHFDIVALHAEGAIGENREFDGHVGLN